MGFKKGQGGRPKGAVNKGTVEERTYWREFFCSATYRTSLAVRIAEGKAPHMEKLLYEKTFGKPVEQVELSGVEARPVRVVHEYHPG